MHIYFLLFFFFNLWNLQFVFIRAFSESQIWYLCVSDVLFQRKRRVSSLLQKGKRYILLISVKCLLSFNCYFISSCFLCCCILLLVFSGLLGCFFFFVFVLVFVFFIHVTTVVEFDSSKGFYFNWSESTICHKVYTQEKNNIYCVFCRVFYQFLFSGVTPVL